MYKIKRFSWFGSRANKFTPDISELDNLGSSVNYNNNKFFQGLAKMYPQLSFLPKLSKIQDDLLSFTMTMDDYGIWKDLQFLDLYDVNDLLDATEDIRQKFMTDDYIALMFSMGDDVIYDIRSRRFGLVEYGKNKIRKSFNSYKDLFKYQLDAITEAVNYELSGNSLSMDEYDPETVNIVTKSLDKVTKLVNSI